MLIFFTTNSKAKRGHLDILECHLDSPVGPRRMWCLVHSRGVGRRARKTTPLLRNVPEPTLLYYWVDKKRNLFSTKIIIIY